MVFSSLIFLWIFLPAVFILSRINRSIPYQNILLLIVSLVFYAWGEPVYILLLLFSILFNWASGLLMDKAKGSKKMVLAAAVVVNLAVLGFFKYADFAVATVNRIPGVDLPLPGISSTDSRARKHTYRHIFLQIPGSFLCYRPLQG